jgi:molecular chaperone DnaJ
LKIKDYYKRLEVSPTASPEEIKKSFRRLAMDFHPDRNPGDAIKEALFQEIQEAYEVLSDPHLREEYNYKRWYSKSVGDIFQEKALTPAGLLRECQQILHYVEYLGGQHIQYDVLSHHIRKLLSDQHISILLQYHDLHVNHEILTKIIHACRFLPLRYWEPIHAQLRKLAKGEPEWELILEREMFQKTREEKMDKWKIPIMILITVAICLLFWLFRK